MLYFAGSAAVRGYKGGGWGGCGMEPGDESQGARVESVARQMDIKSKRTERVLKS